ncbi:protein TIME FOR COFFEE isoform X2 [Abrus precatorius]|uniref:Protein TIME FOR COFFEE isoform X2 n=1 Tax=Abrus precatorius TaxID=3816 RepID=A0A8B8MHE0_ABRPR|nr:protein TIME FOR COFFEE isoform X2 [Abrus precatorius]
MDRIREARRSTMAANGLTRRRHRTNSLRDSPEEDGAMELQEPSRLRDRGSGKKDRDRERERERERDRLGRSKRRRGDRLMHSSREDGGEDTSEESINDVDEDDDEDGGGAGGGASVRMLPLNPSSLTSSSSLSNHHRKSYPPAKVFRAAPPTWKAADEMIGVSVPRKARSASTKRSHECWASSGGGIAPEQNHQQPSTSPVRAASVTPASPSSSNASVRKKIKQNGGGKFRPPKMTSSKSASSAQEEIEIEIAEVLYGMMRQPQGPSKQEIIATDSTKFDSREPHKSSGDAKSPISNSQSAPPQNSSTYVTPMSAVAPKRKRPRPVKHEEENPAIFSVRSSPISKAESDQPSKMETCSSNLDKANAGSATAAENLANSQPVQASSEAAKPESNGSSESKPLTEEVEKQKEVGLSKEVAVAPQSPKKESPALQVVVDEREDVKATKANPSMSESENQREEKFQIDLMAPPPPLRSSPERDVANNSVADAEKEVKPAMKEDEKTHRMNKEEAVAAEMGKARGKGGENESQKERVIDLHLDLEKSDRVDTSGNVSMVNKKQQHQNAQRQQQTNAEKNVQSNSLPLPMSVPSWPGGLPPMGYMTPLQGVVSMDGTSVTSAAIPPPHLLFNQPRPKRCATHCYIARNILYHQQIARMNPFWPAAAGSASLYGTKPGNLNVVPSAELHGNVPGRAANSSQDKGHSLAMFPGHIGKDKGSQPPNVDNSSRKQILLQQALPPGAAPSNILHGPAFIFPLNQQQAAAAASVRPGSVKSLPVSSNGAPSSASNSAPPNASAAGAAAATAPTMSFSYPNMPGNETQYLAFLQNNAYPFPIPAHVGGPPAYRGTHAQAFPFFNGSFYSSQMLHPSQIQQQQLPAQSQQSQQGHQNTSISSGSSSSQKQHAQNQQQKPNNATGSCGGGAVGGSLQGFPVTKNPPSQPPQLQQQQQRQNHHTSHPARQVESEMGGEDSPSTADSRLTRATMNIYGQNFAMPMQVPNFALMTPASISGVGSNGNHSEKKQPQQHPGPKAGGETSPAFAMSFASINGATAAAGLDLSSIAQNHSIMQSNHNYQIMAAAQAASAQLKKNYHAPEEGKNVVNSANPDEDRKAMSGKTPATVGQSIAFGRPDVSDACLTSLSGNNVIDTSGRSLNLGSASSRTSASVMPAAINANAAGSQQQVQRNQQQILQHQKQNQFAAAAAAAARNKTPSTSNGSSVYSDNLPSTSSMATKFPNAVSAFPQSFGAQSPQWKNSARATTTSQSPPSMASTPPSVKSLPQQQARSQQAHTQISFAANPKSSTAQVQPASSTQSPSPPVMVGSPTTSSMSKNTGSPRITSTSANNKISQTASLSSQQAKNSSSVPARKSSPVGGRNVPSILSGPQLTPSSGTGSKSQLPQQQQKQQQQQQQISKQALPQAHLFFSSPYVHSQVSQSNSATSTTTAASGYYLPQRRGPEQMQRPGSSGTSSNGATANNSKGSALPTQGLLHPAQFATMPPSGNHHQFVPAGFPYIHPVPSVQVKPAEQKQPAGE